MAATGVGLDTVLRLRPVSEAIEVPLSDVVRALSTVGELEVPVPPAVNEPAESLWLRSRLDAVEPRDAAAVLAASLHELDADPGVVVTWALYGDRLVDRVLETALGADPLRALGLDGAFRAAGAERLMLDPPLAAALQRLPDPTNRVRTGRCAPGRRARRGCPRGRRSRTQRRNSRPASRTASSPDSTPPRWPA